MKPFKFLLLALLFVVPLLVMASIQEEPTSPDEYIALFDSLEGLLILMSLATPLLTNLINSIVKLTGKAVQILSWLSGLLLALLGFYFQLGMFVEIEIWQALLIGLSAGLISNGLFDIGLVKAILKMVGVKTVNSKPIQQAK